MKAARTDGLVERKHREDRVERVRRIGAWQADHPAPDGGRRKIGVDDRDFVAVAHRCQRMEQVGDEQRMDAAQHRYPPLTPPCVRPTTISFWMTIVSSSTGSVTMIAAAASGPHASCSKVSTL